MTPFHSSNGAPLLRGLLSIARVTAAPPLEAPLSTAAAVSGQGERPDSLYNRVVMVGNPRVSIVPVLEAWAREGHAVDKPDLQSMIKKMKTMRRYAHALEISLWMSDRRYFYVTPGDAAYRLELSYKVHGLDHAAKCFNNLPKQLKVFQTYGALLSCYAGENLVQEAEALFEEMNKLDMISAYSCNQLLRLYTNIGQLGKVHGLVETMEAKGISPDLFTYDVLVEAYASALDVDGIDKVFWKIKHHQGFISWHTYATAAKGYTKAGLHNRALSALKKSEKQIPEKKGRVAYGYLLSVYADIGNKDEMYRIWNTCKSRDKASNSIYMCMISSLLKLDDFEGAESILEEWEATFTFYDFRVPNLLIGRYCMKGLLEKAEVLVQKVIENGIEPFANTWDRFADAYFKNAQILKAVEMTKRALITGHVGWKPNLANVLSSLEHFMEQSDIESADEIVKLLKRVVPLTRDVYHSLLRIYVVSGKPVSDLLARMREDGIDPDEETSRIVEEQSKA